MHYIVYNDIGTVHTYDFNKPVVINGAVKIVQDANLTITTVEFKGRFEAAKNGASHEFNSID